MSGRKHIGEESARPPSNTPLFASSTYPRPNHRHGASLANPAHTQGALSQWTFFQRIGGICSICKHVSECARCEKCAHLICRQCAQDAEVERGESACKHTFALLDILAGERKKKGMVSYFIKYCFILTHLTEKMRRSYMNQERKSDKDIEHEKEERRERREKEEKKEKSDEKTSRKLDEKLGGSTFSSRNSKGKRSVLPFSKKRLQTLEFSVESIISSSAAAVDPTRSSPLFEVGEELERIFERRRLKILYAKETV